MAKQTINGLKILLMKAINKPKKISIFILIFISINSFSSEPIAYLNSLGYEPAQKELASSKNGMVTTCLLYTSPSPRDLSTSRMPSSA